MTMRYPGGDAKHTRDYLITADVEMLFRQWGASHGLIIPPHAFFRARAIEIVEAVGLAMGEDIFVYHVPAKLLVNQAQGALGRIMKTEECMGREIISLDRSFGAGIASEFIRHNYEATRVVQWKSGQWASHGDGPGPRPTHDALETQIEDIVGRLQDPSLGVVVFDDGCFMGESLRDIESRLQSAGSFVSASVFAVRRHDARATGFDFPLHHVLYYDSVDLFDWVCERDFIFGCPDGGRVVVDESGDHRTFHGQHCNALYLSRFGMPSWASFGHLSAEAFAQFTQQALDTAHQIYRCIEELSSRTIRMHMLERWPCYDGAPLDVDPSTPVCEAINALRQ
jgi:hypothetical protein